MEGIRIDVVSDTHGYLSKELLDALRGTELIVHAGDICSRSDYEQLSRIAPIKMCLGNNDWNYDYGPTVKRIIRFSVERVRFEVCHHREALDPTTFDVGVCGHTHRASIENEPSGAIVMNPGSPTFPRTQIGATIGRIYVKDGSVLSSEIVQLEPAEDEGDAPGSSHWWPHY